MSDFEEKINPEEEVPENEAVTGGDAPLPPEEQLNEELEELREMFETELEKASAEAAEETAAPGEELYEASEPEESIEPELLCQCCEEKLRDTSLGEDYPYCAECRRLMQKMPFGFKGIAALVCVLVLIFVSIIYVFPTNLEVLSGSITADEHLANKKIYSALYTYYDAVSVADETAVPKKSVARLAKIFAQLNDFASASAISTQFLSQTDLKLPTYSFLNEYANKAETVSALDNALYSVVYSDDVSADDIDEIIASIDEMASAEGADYDKYYVEYYKYIVINSLGGKAEDKYNKLLEIEEAFGDDTGSVHYYDLCSLSGRMGKIEEAEKYFNKLVAVNVEDAAAYTAYAEAYRFAETPDPDKMIEIADRGITAQGTYQFSVTDLYRVQAIAYLMKGDTDKAMECASKMHTAMASNNYSVANLFEGLYTYALCALLADDTEAYENVKGLLEYNGYEIPKSIIKAAKSEDALKAILVDSEGELA